MKLLLLIALLAIVGLIWALIRKSGSESVRHDDSASAEKTRRSTDPMGFTARTSSDDPRRLKVRDMVEYMNTTYVVREVLNFREGPYTWKEVFLDASGNRKAYLAIEEDPDLTLVWWSDEELPDSLKPEKTITVGGKQYKRDDQGVASYTADVGRLFGKTGELRYWDYELIGEGLVRISIEQYGEGAPMEMSSGLEIDSSQLTIYQVGTPT